MKKLYFLLFILFSFTEVKAQIINFPDQNFKMRLLRPNQYGFDQLVNGNLQPITQLVAKDINNYPMIIDQNNDGNITQSEALAVYYLDVSIYAGLPFDFMHGNEPISNLTGIEYFTNLRLLNCGLNSLTALPISSNLNLSSLGCDNNQLSNIDISQNVNLTLLDCSDNQLSTINVATNTLLTYLKLTNNNFSSINLSQNTALNSLDLGGNNFTTIDLSHNTALSYLSLIFNSLTSINLSNNTQLYHIGVQNNQITTLDLTHNPLLTTLYCGNNPISSLNLFPTPVLAELNCYGTQITNLDLSQNPVLRKLYCGNNSFSSLDLSQNPLLYELYCANNQLGTLDLSQNGNLSSLNCSDNSLLSYLNIKNGRSGTVTFERTPNLQFICADEEEVAGIQNSITQYGYSNCNVNSYCSFVPGGLYYTIAGDQKFDENNNGCDPLDAALPNLKFTIANGSNSGSLISNTLGNYAIPVVTGTHTITPVFENTAYFSASPANIVVEFPAQASPFNQNFCITANGVHPDLEVILTPMVPARPGFDTVYKLIYKNKGTNTQSGTINLSFNDAVLDFVSATPAVSTQALDNLSWDFTSLQPFESREITITLNVNSPMESPAVNGGDLLNYTAAISSAATDETPADNSFILNQTVVNSYDPNDKTCLEGATISPSEVGKYVHYMIRFENTGTFPAENIVVKDMIDTNKFDINSLVPIKGSHSFVTNITAGNKVEFIFENINLPFDDANNDGFVAFKIKTKPTLVTGNTFSNSASIYFDYNFPIVTNTATTTIQALSTQDFAFGQHFSLYPNPVKDVLNIETKQTIEVSSVSIYNQLGQLILVVPSAQNVSKVDVSSLSSGNYFIKINSDKGTSNTKFIKL